jgi:hypothetical protein
MEARDWPVIEHLIGPLAEWWRRRAAVRENLTDLDAFSPEEMARMAQDVGISASDLRALATHCTDAADLLDRRLEALGIDSGQLALSGPAELRDMQRLCTTCQSKGRCARDLADDPDDPVWRQYCPNEETLIELAQAGVER